MKQVHREPHPFCSKEQLNSFIGKTIAFVGKVDRVEDNCLFMRTSDGKYFTHTFLTAFPVDSEVKVIKFKGDADRMRKDSVMEIRGIVNKDCTISYGEFTQYDNEFDLGTYESMLGYYHGMCRDLCIK